MSIARGSLTFEEVELPFQSIKEKTMAILSERRSHVYPEGKVATAIEKQTARLLPSDLFLWAAGASILASLALKLRDREEESLFVGQWAPTLLLLGIYNKMVKYMGAE
jgi:hypothetical protein